jgi:hypothetical protein
MKSISLKVYLELDLYWILMLIAEIIYTAEVCMAAYPKSCVSSPTPILKLFGMANNK